MDSFVNLVAIMLLNSSFVLFFCIERGKPWTKRNLVIGIMLVIIATMSVYFILNHQVIIDLPFIKNKLTDNTVEKINSNFWIIIFPLIYGGIGINLISSWFLSIEPVIELKENLNHDIDI